MQKGCKSQRGWRTLRTRPLNQHDRCSCDLTEPEAACTGPAWICTKSSVYTLCLLVQWFYGIPECMIKCLSDWVFFGFIIFFKTFYRFFVSFTSCTPIPLICPSPCMCPPPLQPAHQQRKPILAVEAAVCHGVCPSTPFCLFFLVCTGSLQ